MTNKPKFCPEDYDASLRRAEKKAAHLRAVLEAAMFVLEKGALTPHNWDRLTEIVGGGLRQAAKGPVYHDTHCPQFDNDKRPCDCGLV